MKINEVSKRTNLTQKTIRYYEERGLIEPDIRLIQGRKFRDYDKKTVEQLTFIATLRTSLFSIDEIKIMIEQPDKIQDILLSYENRIKGELKERTLILSTLSNAKDSCAIKDIKTLSSYFITLSNQYTLPACDLNLDFSHLDQLEASYHNQKERRIYTRFSIFAKKVNAIELFVLELLWKKGALDFSTITRYGLQQGIFHDSTQSTKLLKRMRKRKLIQYNDGLFTALVSSFDISYRNFDLMLQTAYNGSPSNMIYTPPTTPTSFWG